MDVREAICKRYSVRKYKAQPVDEAMLAEVLEAARLAPSGSNRQPWKFVVVRDADLRAKLVEACNGQAFVGTAPVVIAACGTLPDRMMSCDVPGDPVDVAIAIDHMTLRAAELGLGTCWIGALNQTAVRDVLSIPADAKVIEVLVLGHPADAPPPAKKRKDLDEIVCWDRWS